MDADARMKRGVSRIAKLLAIASVLTLLLTAASLAVNHIELSMSLRGDPWDAGDGSVESTHLQLGFRDAWFYASTCDWLRHRTDSNLTFQNVYTGITTTKRVGQWIRVDSDSSFWKRSSEFALNGWALAALLGLYPLIAFFRYAWRSRRKPENACLTCHYDLTGNISGICPECGGRTDICHPGKSPSSIAPITASRD